MPVSGRIDRRQRLKGSRELGALANSPGWIAAADHLLKTPGSELRVLGRRTSLLPQSDFSPPRTRRKTLAVPFDIDTGTPPHSSKDSQSDALSETSSSSGPRRFQKKKASSKLPKVNEDMVELKEKQEKPMTSVDSKSDSGKSDKSRKRIISSDSKEDPVKVAKVSSKKKDEASESDTSKPPVRKKKQPTEKKMPLQKQNGESRGKRRRNARLHPYSIKATIEEDASEASGGSEVNVLQEKVDAHKNAIDDIDVQVERCLTSKPTLKMSRVDRRPNVDSDENDVEMVEETEIMQSSMIDNTSGNESLLNDSKSRCLIL